MQHLLTLAPQCSTFPLVKLWPTSGDIRQHQADRRKTHMHRLTSNRALITIVGSIKTALLTLTSNQALKWAFIYKRRLWDHAPPSMCLLSNTWHPAEGSATAYEILESTGFHMDFRFQSGFLDFKVDFWISKWISGFQADFWILFEPLLFWTYS